MKIDFGKYRITKKGREFFHVVFSLISVFLMGILFVVADEDRYVYDDGHGYVGDETGVVLGKGLFGDTIFGKSILGNGILNLRNYNVTCNKGYIFDGEKCVYEFEFEDIVYTGIIEGEEVQVALMDRNLGATTNDISDTGSYGYFYQWGNNYPFSNSGDVLVTGEVDDISVYSWQNPYYSYNFVTVGNNSWFDGDNKDLWGGSGDVLTNNYDNGEDKIRRQGPCPDGYYVPSLNDVYQLFELYFNNNGIVEYDSFPSQVGESTNGDLSGFDSTLLLNEFKIPVAGFLDGSYNYERYSGYTGDSYENTASMRSSTPGSNEGDGYTWEVYMTPANKISIGGTNYSSMAMPIRCFKYVVDCEENTHQEGWDCVPDTMTGGSADSGVDASVTGYDDVNIENDNVQNEENNIQDFESNENQDIQDSFSFQSSEGQISEGQDLQGQSGNIETDLDLDLPEEIVDDPAEMGDVLEYTEEDRESELAQIWETLNKEKIEGEATYNNITVNVEAPKNSFPEGIELRIVPITSSEQRQAIKAELVDKTKMTENSALVSFDISFIYTLSNGEEVEIQPAEGQTVKVSFNYKKNSKFNKIKKENDQELKIYHFEKVQNQKNRESEEISIKEINVNKSESTEGEIVIDADSFSIYSVAAEGLRGVPMCTVTFQNGECYFGTQEKDGTCDFDMPAPIEVECGGTVSRQDIDEPYYTNTTSKYDETYNYNYYFTRWTTTLDPGYTSTNYNYDFSTPVTEDITLYAIGAYKSSSNGSNNANYTKTVTFNANGGTLTSTGSMLYGMYGLIKQPSDPVRAGYMLNCWSTRQTDTSCSYAYDFNSTTNTVTNDVSLYAQWSSLSYTIRFNANAGNGSINDINASYNNDYQLPSSGFSRNGYDLVGWNTESDGSGTGYDLGEVVRNITTTNGDIIILYAQWGQMNRVTFEGNGGTVSVSYIDVVSGQVAEAPEEPTWSKHGFLGWYLTGSNSVFNFSTPITSDITLYAHWEELETVTVTFNSNGGSSVEPQEINPGERAVKPTNPTKNNQGFKYWTTDSEGNNEYDFKTPVTDDLILYAQWANICTVTFQNGYCYYNNNTNAQCTFSFTTTSVSVACGTPVERPEDPDSPITVTMGSRYNQQDRDMYFSKWSRTQNPGYNNTSNNYDFSTPVTSNLTLYAIGYVSYFTVTFNANGGMLNGSSSVTVGQYTRNNTVYGGYARRPEDPIRTGYDFKWWSTSNSTNGSEFDFNTTRITADTPLYALWTPITYTIKYNANGGVGNMANTDMTYGTAQNLRTNTFTKANATFSGWNTKANESGTGYSNGESVNNLTDVAGRTINLYAQWNCNSGYHDDGGECVQDAQDCEFLGQTIADGSGLVVYSTPSPTCPTICTTGIVTCTNGVLGGDTGYTNLTCAPVSTTCDASFTLNSTGANGTYDSCTPYTANDNSCNAGTTVYKLTNCANGFHTEDNSSCTSDTKQVACIQNGKPEHSSYVAGNVNITWQGTWNNGSRSTADNCAWTCDSHYHTGVNNNSCEIDTFQITWLSGDTQVLNTDTVEYGSTVILPGFTLTGYTFSGWYTQGGVFVGGSGSTFTYDITQDLSLYARWIANTGTHYTVKHWLQNADDDLYTESVSDRDVLTGTTDTQTQAVAKNYSGFTANGFSQTQILGDESTVVNIYYDRDVYTITIDLNGGIGVSSLTGRYGQTISAPLVTKEGYVFKKWIPGFPSTMPLYGTSVRAIWGIADADISINIVSITGNNFDLGSVKISNSSQVITGSLGENSFQLVDNKGEDSGYIVTISVSSLIGQINSINQIGASNVKLKSQGITTISGALAEDIGITSNVTSWSTAVNPITYLTRPDIVVLGDPMIGTYGDNLQLQVTIPAHTYPDQYLGTITYTLYN